MSELAVSACMDECDALMAQCTMKGAAGVDAIEGKSVGGLFDILKMLKEAFQFSKDHPEIMAAWKTILEFIKTLFPAAPEPTPVSPTV